MNIKPKAWFKKGIVAGVGGAALALVLMGAGVASADETGKYCVAKDTDGKCVVYGTRPVIWGGADNNSFVAAAEAPVTIEPGYYDYLLNPKYNPYSFYYGYNFYPYTYYYFPYGSYSTTIVTSANLPAPVYVVVAAAADAMGVDRGYVYSLLRSGETLDQVTDHFAINNTTFLNAFYVQLEARISETLANGTLQPYQANNLRTNAHLPWFITTPYLLNSVAQF